MFYEIHNLKEKNETELGTSPMSGLTWHDLHVSCGLWRRLVTTEKSRWDVEHHTINIEVV